MHHARHGDDDPDELAASLIAVLEGEHPDIMFEALDALRACQLYDVSTVLLEAAWHAELPPGSRGRVAEDWLGTVAKGLGDQKGLTVVAEYLVKTLGEYDAAFGSDLAHLLLSYELYTIAAPLVIEAAEAMPGDLSAQYHLGVIHKFGGDWAKAVDAFDAVIQARPDDKAALWNVGIAATALRQWPRAREVWTKIGFELPPGDGDFGDTEGEQLPVRLPCVPGSPMTYEAIWAVRLGPARARLKGIPRFARSFSFNDVVLIDGAPVAELNGPDGQRHSVFAALEAFDSAQRPVIALRRESIAPSQVDAILDGLRALGIPLADWRVFDFDTTYCVAVSPAPSDAPVTTLIRTIAPLGLPEGMVWDALPSSTHEDS
ncbi:MAG: tetratricopeptide repeat protein [Myxococcota bacterium]|nr:tetratricopeptide repeat protein [Myxococcota bacterium]